MTPAIAFLFLLLGAMVYLFMTERIPVDVTAFAGLSVLVLTGYLQPGEAFSGFSSPAVITMLAIFIVGGAMLRTGVAEMVGGRIHRLVGSRELPLVLVLMLASGALSAFMNNIAATAVLMPAVASVARHASLSPSRLFMPLAFGAILGGTTTLVGTPPNLLAAEVLRERGLEPFGLFDFTPVGVALLACGVLFMAVVGRRLLPARAPTATLPGGPDLAGLYQLGEALFSLRVPAGSGLDGRSLEEARLGAALGAQVVAILRDGQRRLAPGADEVVRAGDILLLRGSLGRLRELMRVQGVEVEPTRADAVPRPGDGVSGLRGRIAEGSAWAGYTLRGLRFREEHGVVVMALARGEALLRQGVGDEPLQAGDEILALGPTVALEELARRRELSSARIGLGAVRQLVEGLYLIRVAAGSGLVGRTLAESRLGELADVTVGGLVREGQTRLGVAPDEVIRVGDELLLAGEPQPITALLAMGGVELDPGGSHERLESDEVGLVEAVVAPRATVVGRTLRELRFRERWGLQAVAIWRRDRPLHAGLGDLPLEVGDALLLQGARGRIRHLAADADFVVLSTAAQEAPRTRKAPFALGALGLMVGFVMAGFQPIHVAAFVAATVVVLTGAITMEESYRAVEWRAIFLVAAVLPVGIAMERSGAAALLADLVTAGAQPLGPYALLGALVALSSLLSQGLDGAPAVVLLAPVVLDAAGEMGISPYPLMMGVSLAASAAFMTPFSHKANLLVMGAGGYRAVDYARVGTPLTVLLLALITVLVPVFFAF